MATDIKKYINGEEISLPGWGDEDVVFKLKRPSLISLAAKGLIPNSLMGIATKLFKEGGKVLSEGKFEETADVLMLIAKEALVSPTMAEIDEAGLHLTDEMLTHIYLYATKGATYLSRFRGIAADNDGDSSGEGAQPETE